jgi:cyclopropane fatty-acyl-phospholipid synthase-like methyltransferase
VSKAYININLKKRKNIKLEQMDAEKLNVKNTYDFVYSWGAIHHLANPKKIYTNIFNSLKEEGKFLIMVYNKNSLRYYFKGFYQLFIKLKVFKGYSFESVQKFYTDGYYHKHYTPRKLIEKLKKIGFKDLKYELTHMSKKYTPFFDKNTNVDNFLKKNFGWLLVVTGKK